MRLENRPLKFSNITHHASVTQCLGSIGGHVWYLGVAKPSIVNSSEVKDDKSKMVVQSRSGHLYVPPAIEDIQVFKVSGSKFLKLNKGTWHAGPLFKADSMDFYNLELSDTNVSIFHLSFLQSFPCILLPFYGLILLNSDPNCILIEGHYLLIIRLKINLNG